ncbi:hypothetical protein JMJ35_002000 [Cladonia borealis]|uniref:Coatomer subunit epsilon n=1 Tax=Cladonia borealis TaxID=184061 RepID=A0AA39UDY2_9LECA|nr:hypothetical protein JMJ35_002000 [Cladonia borealis]
MDPFSAEGELLNIHNAFYQGQYKTVVEFDTSSLSAENKVPARTLQLRAQIASGQAKEVLANVKQEGNAPDFVAVKALAQYSTGDVSGAVSEVERLVGSQSEHPTVQVLGGIVLQGAGKTEEALSLLGKHQGSLEAIALTVQIHLQQNRTDLALKEVQAARKWAQDSLLVNIAESWVGLRLGGERYQQAFYVFEEMAQVPSTSATKSLVGQAVAELHLGRLPEAEAALQQALQKDPKDVEAIANFIVLNIISGKDSSELRSSLESAAPEHLMLVDLREKSQLFDQAATKYSAKAAS